MRRCLPVLLIVIALLVPFGTAWAASYAVELDVDGPRSLKALLHDNLSIVEAVDAGRDIGPDQFDVLVRKSVQEIADILTVEGYFNPDIVPKVTQDADRSTALFTIKTGRRVIVRTVTITLEGPINDNQTSLAELRTRLNAEWGLPVDAPFREDDWSNSKNAVLRTVQERYFPGASLTSSKAEIDPEQNSAALTVVVNSGPVYHFGTLTSIEGLVHYPESVIRNLNPIRQGSTFSQRDLYDFQTRLQDTGYFNNIVVTAPIDPLTPEVVPIKVKVGEEQRLKLAVGLGYSTDSRAKTSVEYDDMNLFQNAWRVKSTLELASPKQTFSTNVYLPPDSDAYRDALLVGYKHETTSDTLHTYTSTMGASRTWGARQLERTASLNYVHEFLTTDGLTNTSTSDTLTASYITTYRQLNNQLYPTRGYLAEWQVSAAPLKIIATTPFLRVQLRGNYYYPLSARDTLVVRGALGYVWAQQLDGVPQDYLFSTGGDTTIRGYAYQSLGVNTAGVVSGGRFLLWGSTEWQHWFTTNWGGAVFVDGGNASAHYNDYRPVFGSGFGARWRTPVGPLSVDIAWASETHKPRLHLVMGVVF